MQYISFLLFCISISVPRNIIAASITVRGTVKPNVVHIHINNVSSRIPHISSCYTAWMLNLILLCSVFSSSTCRWMLYAPAEYQSSFSSLWWPLLGMFGIKQPHNIGQDDLLQSSPSVYPKLRMCAPFMWGSEQETVQECLHPVKQLKWVSCNLLL